MSCVLTLFLNTLIAFDRDKVEFRVPFFCLCSLSVKRPALANENSM